MAKQYGFEKLEVFQDARIYVRQVYLLTSTFAETEKYGLCSQLQRAAVSIVSNIVEGTTRASNKEKETREFVLKNVSWRKNFKPKLASAQIGYRTRKFA